jgi:hypothetical protein
MSDRRDKAAEESQTTRCSSGSPVRRRRQFSVTIERLRSSVSVVSQARCGVTVTRSVFERPDLAPAATTTLGSRASDRATVQYDRSEEPP